MTIRNMLGVLRETARSEIGSKYDTDHYKYTYLLLNGEMIRKIIPLIVSEDRLSAYEADFLVSEWLGRPINGVYEGIYLDSEHCILVVTEKAVNEKILMNPDTAHELPPVSRMHVPPQCSSSIDPDEYQWAIDTHNYNLAKLKLENASQADDDVNAKLREQLIEQIEGEKQ